MAQSELTGQDKAIIGAIDSNGRLDPNIFESFGLNPRGDQRVMDRVYTAVARANEHLDPDSLVVSGSGSLGVIFPAYVLESKLTQIPK